MSTPGRSRVRKQIAPTLLGKHTAMHAVERLLSETGGDMLVLAGMRLRLDLLRLDLLLKLCHGQEG
jgi:hypothetical protein